MESSLATMKHVYPYLFTTCKYSLDHVQSKVLSCEKLLRLQISREKVRTKSIECSIAKQSLSTMAQVCSVLLASNLHYDNNNNNNLPV